MNKNRFFTTILLKLQYYQLFLYLMLLQVPIPFIPSFYELDLSEVPVLIGGFSLGPLAAISIEGVKILLKIIIEGTSTAYVGEVANFIVGCAFGVPASIIYLKNKTKQNAVKSLIVGGISMVITAMIMNYFVLLPAYSYFYKMDLEVIIGMGTALIPIIKNKLTFVLFATTPFNTIKAIVVSLFTFALYKHISPLLKNKLNIFHIIEYAIIS